MFALRLIYFGGNADEESLKLCGEPGEPEENRPDINDDGDGWGNCDGDGDPGTVIEPLGGATPLIDEAGDELDIEGKDTDAPPGLDKPGKPGGG